MSKRESGNARMDRSPREKQSVSRGAHRVWAGTNGDRIEYIVWPDRGLVHLKLVDQDVTLCNCGTYGPWVQSGEPAAEDLCPGCDQRRNMLTDLVLVIPPISVLLPAAELRVCTACGVAITDSDRWHRQVDENASWQALFDATDFAYYHLTCWIEVRQRH